MTEAWREWPDVQKRRMIDEIMRRRGAILRQSWQPYPWQRPHLHPEGWTGTDGGPWCDDSCLDRPVYAPRAHDRVLLMGGRGVGKTDYGVQHVLDHIDAGQCDARAAGGHRIAIIAPTVGDAVEACVSGPSGLTAYDPRIRAVVTKEGTVIRFPGGARARLFGANSPDDVDRLRAGGNLCLAWLDEMAAQRHLGAIMDTVSFGLRLGDTPHYVMTTTPRARPEVVKILDAPNTIVTRGRTRDAYHLPQDVREALEAEYAGTRIGRQEMDGEVLTDIEGALWRTYMIDEARVAVSPLPPLRRIVIGVDPAAGGPDETGIVVAGVGRERMPDAEGYTVEHFYVLDDLSARFENPARWGEAVVAAARRWGADAIVAEVNNGGDMVPHVIRTIDPNLRIKVVRATRGKIRRAEPIVSLYERRRAHHAGALPTLEDQMTTWTETSSYSPDRLDALVWALTDLSGDSGSARGLYATI